MGGQVGGTVPPGVAAREPFGDWSYDAIRSHVDTLKADPISGRARAWQSLGAALAQQEQSLQDDISKVIGNGWSGVGADAAGAGVGSFARDGGESATTVQAIGGKVAESGESIAQTVSQFPARVDDGVTGASSLLQGVGHFIGFGDGPAGPGGWHQGLVSAHNQELNAARDAARRVMTTVYQPGVAASDNGVPALTKPVDPVSGGPGGAGVPFGGGAGSSGGSTGGATGFDSLHGGGSAPGADGSATGGGPQDGQVPAADGVNPLSGNHSGSGDGAGATGGTGLGSGQSADPAGTSAVRSPSRLRRRAWVVSAAHSPVAQRAVPIRRCRVAATPVRMRTRSTAPRRIW
ncbi:hypothetical protein G4X40_14250 [Rhodococcus sp. D2-41]|uniref:PPE family domain-containing protein n=1 Tax=Speluncibacter jeojiensis TaxID=2710754 RepID=A0A9X4M421_9ACTN|nr:hypothetical protein [Rhodococcus sp. D2-41]MDG3011313.1 hypothetical protein [Rhodococcus sp. D2-41]MDG3016675.1 hypothetical protein [Corynebacteriales bacterium D3-21]